MGLFGDKDAQSIPDNPFRVESGTYSCVISDAEVRVSNTGRQGLSFQYTITEPDSEFNGMNVSEWKTIYTDTKDEDVTPEITRSRSFLKSRLLDFGLTDEDMDNLLDNMDGLVGIEGYVTVVEKSNDDNTQVYTNVRSFKLSE